jgi:hypothetical protein
MGLFEINWVVGTGCAEQLLCETVCLPEPASSVKEITKTVLVDATHATLGNVIVEGRLRAQFLFPAMVSRVLKGLDQETAFTALLPVPGAAPDMIVTVEDAFTAASVTTVSRSDQRGAILALIDRSLLHLAVRVSTPVEVAVARGQAPGAAAAARTTAPPTVQQATVCHFQAAAPRLPGGKKARHS